MEPNNPTPATNPNSVPIDIVTPQAPVQQTTPAAAIPPAPSNSGKKVLCVEDEPFISDLYRHALEKAGYSVVVTADGKSGLVQAQTNEFDIILLDIVIPQMQGIDVLHAIKATPNLKAKIIIATNLEQDDETRAAIEREADAYIIKAEITPTELVEFLSHF